MFYLLHDTKLGLKYAGLRLSLSLGGGGLDPKETLSLSNGNFVFDRAPKRAGSFRVGEVRSLLNVS